MPEERADQIRVRKDYRQQQRHAHSAEIYPQKGLKAGKRGLILLDSDVHLLKTQPQPGEIRRFKDVQRHARAEKQQQTRDEQRHEKHEYIRSGQTAANGHCPHLLNSLQDEYIRIMHYILK